MDGLLEPIVILAMPRSGSSMTAGIFAHHGVWVGRCHGGTNLNPKGHFENLDIKDILIRRWGKIAQTTHAAAPQEGFRTEIERLLENYHIRGMSPPDGKWAVKHSALYRRAWHEFSPTFICVRRKIAGLLGSNGKTGFLGTRDEMEMRQIIEAHNREMDASCGYNVYTDDLIKGDYSSICIALEACKIVPDIEKIRGFVDPSLWERWSS